MSEFAELWSAMGERLETLESEVLTVGAGMPVMDTCLFLQSSEGIFVANFGGGRLPITITRESIREQDVDRASYMLDYLSRLIRLVEENYPGVLAGLKLEPPDRPE